MKIEDVMDLTLGEILNKYGVLLNPECDFVYGFVKYDDVEKLYDEYDVDTYKEAVEVDTFVPSYILTDCREEFLNYEDLEKIMSNLDIKKK